MQSLLVNVCVCALFVAQSCSLFCEFHRKPVRLELLGCLFKPYAFGKSLKPWVWLMHQKMFSSAREEDASWTDTWDFTILFLDQDRLLSWSRIWNGLGLGLVIPSSISKLDSDMGKLEGESWPQLLTILSCVFGSRFMHISWSGQVLWIMIHNYNQNA